MEKLVFYLIVLLCVLFQPACMQKLTTSKVFVSKAAEKEYNEGEEFVHRHFKNYSMPANILFEIHKIYFNDNNQYTVSKLGAYESVKALNADKQLQLSMASNKKESYTSFILLRNYDLYKEIEILNENDIMLYFPNINELKDVGKTSAFYELDDFVNDNWNKYVNLTEQLTLIVIPVENDALRFDKVITMGSGPSIEEILIQALEQNLPIIENAIYVELAAQSLLENYRVISIYDALWLVKNYLTTYKVNADATTLMSELKANQQKLSNKFSSLNKRLQSINNNEALIKEKLNEILNKIE